MSESITVRLRRDVDGSRRIVVACPKRGEAIAMSVPPEAGEEALAEAVAEMRRAARESTWRDFRAAASWSALLGMCWRDLPRSEVFVELQRISMERLS